MLPARHDDDIYIYMSACFQYMYLCVRLYLFQLISTNVCIYLSMAVNSYVRIYVYISKVSGSYHIYIYIYIYIYSRIIK